jgi:phosphodiesterase/alkaline phosphatase D-like protein
VLPDASGTFASRPVERRGLPVMLPEPQARWLARTLATTHQTWVLIGDRRGTPIARYAWDGRTGSLEVREIGPEGGYHDNSTVGPLGSAFVAGDGHGGA